MESLYNTPNPNLEGVEVSYVHKCHADIRMIFKNVIIAPGGLLIINYWRYKSIEYGIYLSTVASSLTERARRSQNGWRVQE